MIFSAFAILNFTTTAEKSKQTINNPSVPVVSYTQFGETVSFIGSQPVISFGSTEYPTSWNILNIEQPSHLSANPLHSTGNNSNSTPYLSAAQFNSYTTSRINNSAQNSANLIQYGKGIQAASVFFFHNYTMSSSLAFKNLLNHSVAYMVDFTMILPETGSFTEGGAGSKNVKMNNGSGIINPSCYDIQIGGVNINWQSESSLFHGGIITQKYNHDILAAPMGPVTLAPNETYTIDPQIEPAPQAISGGGIYKNSGGGGGGTQNPCTLYPPEFSDVSLEQSSSTCFSNGSSEGKVAFNYTLNSPTGNGPITVGFFETADNGNEILIGTSDAYQGNCYSKEFKLNTIGSYSHLGLAYKSSSSGWNCIETLGHYFNTYINPKYGYVYPNAGRVVNSNGKVIASVSGAFSSISNPVYTGNQPNCLSLYQIFYSKGEEYGACKRSVFLNVTGNDIPGGETFDQKESTFGYVGTSCITNSTKPNIPDIVLYAAAEAFVIAGAIVAAVSTDGLGIVPFSIFVGGSATSILGLLHSKICLTTEVNRIITGNRFECVDDASKTIPNEPHNYFYYGCYLPVTIFNENLTFKSGELEGTNIPSHFMQKMEITQGFKIFNTTLTGNSCRTTYGISLSNPLDLEYNT